MILMSEFIIEPVYGLVVAIMVLWIGDLLTKNIPFLSKYNIPAPVTGGILISVLVAIIYGIWDVKLTFNLELRDILLLAFFSTIGLIERIPGD